jgi:hypothetical protein
MRPQEIEKERLKLVACCHLLGPDGLVIIQIATMEREAVV